MMYGMETVSLTAGLERKLHAMEICMLRWMLGITRRDKVRNEKIRSTIGVRDIAEKLEETRLRWYGHVQRKPEEHIGKQVLNMESPGRRHQGRPKEFGWIA